MGLMSLNCRVTGPRFSGGNVGLQEDKRADGLSMWLDLTSGLLDVAGPTGRSLNPAIWHVAPLACLNWSVLLPPLKRGPVTQQIGQLPCNVATVSKEMTNDRMTNDQYGQVRTLISVIGQWILVCQIVQRERDG